MKFIRPSDLIVYMQPDTRPEKGVLYELINETQLQAAQTHGRPIELSRQDGSGPSCVITNVAPGLLLFTCDDASGEVHYNGQVRGDGTIFS